MATAPTSFQFTDVAAKNVTSYTPPIGPQAGAQSLSVTPATDALAEPAGLAITGVVLPGGGAGLTGWLSAIWAKLAGTLTVSWTGQTVALGGTLPPFAATPGVTLAAPVPAGANVIGAVNLDIGGATASWVNPVPTSETYFNLNTGQIPVTAAATQICAARPGRKEIKIFNHAETDVYIGAAGVTLATGVLLAGGAGETLTISGGAAVYGVTASITETVSFLEVF